MKELKNYNESDWKRFANQASISELISEKDHLKAIMDNKSIPVYGEGKVFIGSKLISHRLDIIDKLIAQQTDVTSLL